MKSDLETLVECCGLAPLPETASTRELVEYITENYWLNFVWGYPTIYDFKSFDFKKVAQERYDLAVGT